jgi:hypothetical protein
LEAARDHLAIEGIALEIDSDTKDVPGTLAITDTVLAKIRDCDLFLADMTFVAAIGEKLIPNPNVMGEYGYALRDKGTRRILLAMNSAFGPPEKLPFDLHQLRHPAQFKVDGDTADGVRRISRTAFGAQLADHIFAAAKDVFAEAGVRERSHRDLCKAAGGKLSKRDLSMIGRCWSAAPRRWCISCPRQASTGRTWIRAC